MPTWHEADRHETLQAPPWDEAIARTAVVAIAADALTSFTPEDLWQVHPLDKPATAETRQLDLYCGAGGVIWALQHLRRRCAIEGDFDFGATIAELPSRHSEVIASADDAPGSYLFGEVGLLLLQWQAGQAAAVADRLFARIEANLHHKSLEPLWGAPGSLLATIAMAEATGEPRWRDQLERGLRILWEAMRWEPALGAWLWVQDMYGTQCRYLGAGHGFAGNLFTVLRGAALLPQDLVDAYLERAWQTLSATAVHDGVCANWEPIFDPTGSLRTKWLVQDCHGAPGIVCRLAGAPRTPAWDGLLLAGGEATWQAGPLGKGAGLCHGTAGNGYALLKLWQRSGDAVWLERARAFAMHAIGQVERDAQRTRQTRHSLWTGDIGVALFLWACIDGDARFPTLDGF